MTSKSILGGLAVVLSLIGCGSSKDTSTTSGADGGGGNAGSGGSGGSGGIVEAGYPQGVVLLESDSPDGFDETFVSGAFQTKATAGCTRTVIDDCVLTDCRAAKVMPKLSSAGKLTISGGNSPIVINQGSSGSYDLQGTSTSWGSNTMLTVKASGGDVPAFTLQGESPPLMTLSKPDFDADLKMIDRSKDLAVAWTKAKGKVEMLLVRDPDKRVSMTCAWDAAGGSATIPASTLGKVPADSGFTWGVIFRDTIQTQAKDGDWTVTLEISQIGQTSDGVGTDAVDVVLQ